MNRTKQHYKATVYIARVVSARIDENGVKHTSYS
jgi:hypothetical protein